jgi:hypothetical protein
MISRSTTPRTLPGVSTRQRTPVVPLEAGAGPENPPCPACGEPLFGWIDARPALAGPVRRCESCGLGAIGDAGDTAAALHELDHLTEGGTIRIANRAGFSAWIGGAGWAGLEPGRRYLLTLEAVRRLVAQRDQVVKRARWSPRAGIAAMWQTLVNSATFGHDVAIGTRVLAAKEWQRRIDWLAVTVLALPAFVLAVPLELCGAALRRGSVLSLELELL